MSLIENTRLIELRDHIASIPDNQFDMQDCMRCILGHAARKWPECRSKASGSETYPVYGENECAEFFGISRHTAYGIAYPRAYGGSRSDAALIGNDRLWACNMLTGLARTGILDWNSSKP